MKKLVLLSFVALLLVFMNSCEIDPLESGGKKLAEIELNVETAWGTVYTDDFAGSVMDNNGNLYFVGSTSGDGFSQKLFVSKVDMSTIDLVWSKNYESIYSNYFPSSSENGVAQGGGGSRCIAIDESNDIYVAGTSIQGFNKVFVMKLSSSGELIWQTNYAANDFGLANGSAKAFALDVKNNRVYVTGSTGGGTGNEEAMLMLLMFDASTGDILQNSTIGLDVSDGYNDRGYSVKATDDGLVYVVGWEGRDNSGLVIKFSQNGDDLDWVKRIGVGTGHRLTDLDIDSNGDLYIGVDFRGVSTYMGVLKLDSEGNMIFGKKYQGESNDRNNISCLRLLNEYLYVGGKGSFKKYDLSQFGDACLLKLDLNGNIVNEYNYYTGDNIEERCGERIESIHYYNGSILMIGETWPEYSHIQGHWYTPNGNLEDFTPAITNETSFDRITGNGSTDNNQFNATTNSIDLFDLIEGGKGSSDVVLFSITE